MAEWLTMLVTPLRFLRFTHPHKRTWHVRLPLVVGLPLGWAIGRFGLSVFEAGGLVEELRSVFGTMASVNIGLLGLFLTMPRDELDTAMPEEAEITAPYAMGGTNNEVTQREFLCALHGYICFVSAVAFVGLSVINAIVNADVVEVCRWFSPIYRTLFCMALMPVVVNQLVFSAVGLHFLSDVLARFRPKFEDHPTVCPPSFTSPPKNPPPA